MATRSDRRRAVSPHGWSPMPTATNRGAEYPADEDPYDDFIPPVSAARADGGDIRTPSPDLGLNETRLPFGGQTHHQEWIPVSLVPKDSHYLEPVRSSDFDRRPAMHRLTYTMRSFGHWLQENLYGVPRVHTLRRHHSRFGTKNPAPFAAKNRRNSRRPARSAYGDLVHPGSVGY